MSNLDVIMQLAPLLMVEDSEADFFRLTRTDGKPGLPGARRSTQRIQKVAGMPEVR